jgi:hypothetical protein
MTGRLVPMVCLRSSNCFTDREKEAQNAAVRMSMPGRNSKRMSPKCKYNAFPLWQFFRIVALVFIGLEAVITSGYFTL